MIIVSARNDWTEKVAGIEAGADDYLGKPLRNRQSWSRGCAGSCGAPGGRASSSIRIGSLVLDTHRMSATYAGRPVRLSQLEFRFLHYVAHQGGRAVSAGELAEHLYGAAEAGDTNAIEALVVRLRRKLAPEVIETRRGFGYCLAGDSQ